MAQAVIFVLTKKAGQSGQDFAGIIIKNTAQMNIRVTDIR
jgi:hypothetical protein